MEKDRINCSECGHTTKPWLIDEKGRCPACQPESEPDDNNLGEREDYR